MAAGIGPEEYFVWSRVDGSTTVRDILMSTGLPLDRGMAIMRRLYELGAIMLPQGPPRPAAPIAATPPPVVARTATPLATARTSTPPSAASPGAARAVPPSVQRAVTPSRPPPTAGAPTLDAPTAAELAALAEDVELDRDERVRVLLIARRVASGDARAILGVAASADKKDIKRAYFKLSKEVHPDRFYKRRLGTFADRLASNFEAVTRAYQELTETRARAATSEAAATQQPQTPAEYAAELFTRATDLEVHGSPLEAMKLFAAAIRIDPQLKYLRRAASCALAAGQPRTAEEYANKATALDPSDGSIARLLAAAFRQQGKLDAAEEVLVMAMAIPSDKDNLVLELRRELAEIRRAQAER